MPQIATILQDESLNEGAHIRFYAEGIFYKAYERSAWGACRVLHPFMGRSVAASVDAYLGVMLHSLTCCVAVEPSEDFSC